MGFFQVDRKCLIRRVRVASVRSKRSVQIPLLKAAAIQIAATDGKPGSVSGYELTDVDVGTVRFSIYSLGLGTNLDVWDETRGGAKVLNIHWAGNGAIEVVSFRRGDWEQVILDRAKRALN
jgi:hypothetical protein